MADALSRIPQYNNAKLELVQPVIPSGQIAAPFTRTQAKQPKPMPNKVIEALKAALKDDNWFNNYKNYFTLCEGLAWVGGKLYDLKSQRTVVPEKGHDSKIAGHFGFVKTLHRIKSQF